LRRRAASTFLPLAVDILLRKPCLLALFLSEGWNVLFISSIFFVPFLGLYGGLPAVKLSLQKYTNFLNCEQKMFEKKSFYAILFCKPEVSVAKINSCFAV
jgi:hypothetical protein